MLLVCMYSLLADFLSTVLNDMYILLISSFSHQFIIIIIIIIMTFTMLHSISVPLQTH